ncbi:DMT family transporter [Kiloniella laminariae]|uniref:DMT family transporter n=1 Tax=Kiloniella laminariae TaxID=454162 RepID=UPI000370F9B5|nr:DMT family transporter [Kiloniella laminariae]
MPLQLIPVRLQSYYSHTLHSRWHPYWGAIPGNVRGSLLVLLAALSGACMGGLIKMIGQRIPVFEILFIRQLFAVSIIAPVVIRNWRTTFRTTLFRFHLLRGVCSGIAMSAGFTAVVHLPLAQVTAISFVRTLFTTLLAIIFLREVVGIRRWSVTIVGFIGVLIIIQPDLSSGSEAVGETLLTLEAFLAATTTFVQEHLYALLALTGAFFVAAVMIILRKLSQVDKPSTIMAYQYSFITLYMIGPAIWFWVPPSLTDVLIIGVIAALMSLMHWLYIQAFRVAETVAVAPMEYSRLLFATGIGIVFFGEIPTVYTLSGAAIIIASTLYTIHRNALRKRQDQGEVTATFPEK